jgi:DNA polymerase-3 subunit epsilon/exodeoxyribonuclease X
MLIFLDIETTGLTSLDKICFISIIGDEFCADEYVFEGKKISAEASSKNFITNEMLKGGVKFQDTTAYRFLSQHNNPDTTLVLHDSEFVLEYLKRSSFKWYGDVIDTKQVSKHLVGECEQFSLRFLRYELKLYKDEQQAEIRCGIKNAFTIKLLFEYLLELESLDKIKELSYKNILLSKINFGKHSGKYIEEIVANDPKYLYWLLNQNDLDGDLRYSIEYYLGDGL